MASSLDDELNRSISEAVRAFDRLRDAQRKAGVRPYDAAEEDGSRLYFRTMYREGIEQGWTDWERSGDWSGYAIDWAAQDLGFEVVLTRKPERSSRRAESVQAIFSRLEDAAKFIIANVGDSLRVDRDLKTLFLQWRDFGLDDRLSQTAPSEAERQRVIDLLPPGKEELVRNHLQKFLIRADPSVQSIGFPGVKPYMNVMPLTYQELELALLDGMTAG